MNLEIKFTPEAEETYDAVVSQLRQRWGERFVSKFETKLSKIINALSASPHIYPISKENTELRKCILHKNCSMFYKVSGGHILIIYFWDNRHDPIIID